MATFTHCAYNFSGVGGKFQKYRFTGFWDKQGAARVYSCYNKRSSLNCSLSPPQIFLSPSSVLRGLPCPLCGFRVASVAGSGNSLKDHIKSVHLASWCDATASVACSICGVKVKKNSIKGHMKRHQEKAQKIIDCESAIEWWSPLITGVTFFVTVFHTWLLLPKMRLY